MRQFVLGIIFLSVLIFQSCTKDTIEPELYGDIEGVVINSETGDFLEKVNITTAPATNSILTGGDGKFALTDVPTNNYTIFAKKDGYSNTSVAVAVREDKVAMASIIMVPDDEEQVITVDDLEAEIINWYNRQSGDSTYVEVEYKVTNTSDQKDIQEYEVYFEITTDGDTYFVDESGESLRSGQSSFLEFSKYIREFTAQDVTITEVWVSGD